MRVLMLSLDRSLLGDTASTTDAVKRHRRYAAEVEGLHIVVPCPSGYRVEQLADNCFVYPTNSRFKEGYVRHAIREAVSIHRHEPVDIIVAQQEVAAVGALMKMKIMRPFVVSLHGSLSFPEWNKWGIIKPFLMLVFKWALHQADAVRAVSPYIAGMAEERGVAKEKIHVVPTPVDLGHFRTVNSLQLHAFRRQWEGKDVVLYVGRMEPVKNIPLLVDAFSQVLGAHKGAHLVLVGTGSQEGRIREEVAKRGIEEKVTFAGAVSPDRMPLYYHMAQVVVLPSVSESLGKVLIEAGMARVPVVATRNGGAEYIVEHDRTGLLVPQKDAAALARAISRLLGDKRYAKHLGNAAPPILKKKFDYEHAVTQWVQVWKDVAKI